MKKIFIATLCLLLLSINNLLAQQSIPTNAVAKADARKFKLEKSLLKQWRKTKHSTSDYFKPNENTTADKALLTDSTYVKKFRSLTYQKTSLRLSIGRWLLIVGVSIVAVSTLVFIVVNSIEGKPAL